MSTLGNDLPPAPPSPPPPTHRRLTRSRRERVIAGVAGGLGEYFDIDPVIFRIAFVGLAFLGGAGILLYPAAWLLLPEEGHDRSIAESWIRQGRKGKWLPITLIVIGSLILAGDLSTRHHDSGIGFAIAAIVVGVLLFRRHPSPPRPPDPAFMTPPPYEPSAPTPTTPDTPPTDPSSWTPPPPPPPPAPLAPGQGEPPTGGGAYWGPTTEELLPPEPTGGRSLSILVLSVLLIAGGVAGVLHVAGIATVSVPLFLAGALIFTGIALLASAWYGGTPGLIAIAIVLTIALAVAAVVHAPLRGGFGERRWVPSSLDELRSRYRLGAGDLTIDLSHVTPPAEGRVMKASVGAGHLSVVVPDRVHVLVVAHAGLGELNLLGHHDDGWDVDQRLADGDPAYGSLRLDLDVGTGAIDVTRVSSSLPITLRPPTTELPPELPPELPSPPAVPSVPSTPIPPVPTSAAA